MDSYLWMSRAAGACTLIASLFFGITPPLHAADVQSFPPVPVLNWAPCGNELRTAECAIASVPLDYDKPRGATTPVTLAKIPAADPANKIGTVFLNPGGPGGSGVSLVLSEFGDGLRSLLNGRFDIIGFDQRGGEGASAPLQCFETEDDRSAFWAQSPALFPYRREHRRPFFEHYRSLASRCLGRGQAIATHMSTADAARDLDLLRRAVGDERLTYLGFSYGTYLGQTYANLFPNKVRALVLDGVIDPRRLSSGRQFVAVMRSMSAVLDEFLRLCDEAAEQCAFNGIDGPVARFDALVRSLRDAPLVGENGATLYEYTTLIVDASNAMNVPEIWPAYAEFLDAVADAIENGNVGAPQGVLNRRTQIQDQLADAAPQSAAYNNGWDAYYGILCSDSPVPDSFAAFNAIMDFAERTSVFGQYWWARVTPCASWPVVPDRYMGPWSTRTSAPVLVVGNYYDATTDYEGAVASSHLLKNSRLLSYAGWGHTAFNRSECVARYVAEYLLDGALPSEGTVCPANPSPFQSSLINATEDRSTPSIIDRVTEGPFGGLYIEYKR
jgi:pimeloyl-ACP methyl ester carboxylesterase